MNNVLGLSRKPSVLVYVLIALATLFFALFFGLVAAVLPWWLIITLVLLPIVFMASLYAPHLGLFFSLMLIFEVIPSAFQARLPLAGGHLKIYDLLIIYLAIVVLLRTLFKGSGIKQQMGSLWWPLVYLFSVVALSIIYAHFYTGNKTVLAEGRNFIGWALVPLIVLGIDTKNRYLWFMRGILLIGIVIALYVSIQSFFGIRIMTAARVELLDQSGSDVVRSIAGGGTYLMVFALFYFLNRVLDRKLPIVLIVPIIFLLTTGLAVSFGRGVWVATGVGLLVSAFLRGGVKSMIFTGMVTGTMVLLLIGGITLIKPDLAESMLDRAFSIQSEVQSGGSFHWRELENIAALDKIASHPLVGVGIGGEYKQNVISKDSFAIENTYIHNGYLYFPLKMGLLAVFVPLLVVGGFVLTMRDCLRKKEVMDRGFLAATAGAFSVPVITSFTQPEWVVMQSIAAISILISLALLYRRFGAPLEGR